MKRELVPGVERIAVLRANSLGDVIFALPALDALRAAYPQATIDLLTTPWAVPFLRGRPGPVDRVLPVPVVPGVYGHVDEHDPARVARFLYGRRAARYDLAVQLHDGGAASNPFVSSFGARMTVGMRTPEAAPLDRWVRYHYWQHEVLRLLDVVGLVGDAPVGLEPRLATIGADGAAAARAVGRRSQHPLAVLHPGARDPRRRWPPARFAAIGDLLAAHGLEVVVTGIASEREMADEVVGTMREPAQSLAGRLSLPALIGLLARSRLVVSDDTGPLHLARALDTPTVGIYWCGNAVNAGPIRADSHRAVLSWRLQCPTCGVNCVATSDRCPHDASFVDGVTVDDVAAAVLDLLGDTVGHSPSRPSRHPAPGDALDVDVLVPTCDRPSALAVTLASLVGQVGVRFRVVISDQSHGPSPFDAPEVRAAVNVLRATGREVECLRHLPRRGLAEHRQFLLDHARAPYVLMLDDDVVCESDLLARLLAAIRRARCGFIGSFVNAPGSVDSPTPIDEPPEGLAIELWDGPVHAEVVRPDSPAWDRRFLHFAAYLRRLSDRMGIDRANERLYKVAWVGGCVLFDTAILRAAGGFEFWDQLADGHVGEDVVAQLRVMAMAGGAGLVPSGAWHQEVPTTIPHARREVDAPFVIFASEGDGQRAS